MLCILPKTTPVPAPVGAYSLLQLAYSNTSKPPLCFWNCKRKPSTLTAWKMRDDVKGVWLHHQMLRPRGRASSEGDIFYNFYGIYCYIDLILLSTVQFI